MTTALVQLLISFGKIGLFALGGGNSMVALIENEVVHHHHWMQANEFAALVGVSFLFPGLTAVKVAGMIGLKVAGIPGLLVSVLGIALPGLIMTVGFYSLLIHHEDHPLVKKLLILMQYGAVALFAAALVSMGKPLFSGFSWIAGLLACALFMGVALLNFSPFFGLVLFIGGGLALMN